MKTELRSPIPWFGGKGSMARKIVPLIPSHEIYVEAFGGGASLLFAKKPSQVEVYNDIDSGLVNFFRVIRDPAKFERFHRTVACIPYSREEYEICRVTWEKCTDDVEQAIRWFVVARMSFGGLFANSWGSSVTQSARGMAGAASKWLSGIEGLPAVHQRLMRVEIEHSDWRSILERYDTDTTFFYLDPPYVPETRKGGSYRHELTLADHEELVRRLLSIKGKGLLSGYASDVHLPLERAGWRRLDFAAVCQAAGHTRGSGLQGVGVGKAKQSRVESVWVSAGGSIQGSLYDSL